MRAGDQVSSFHVGTSLVVSAGFKNTTLSNKSCGTALVIGKRFSKARMFPPVLASGKIAGRGMGMRVVSSLGDFFPLSAYFPPRPRKKTELGKYRETCRLVAQFICKSLDELPSSCTPVIYADVNDGIGLRKMGSTTITEETTCISTEAARLEHWDGGAGEQ